MLDLAFRNIRRNRTRTFLTVLGIVIGIGAVVGLGSFAEGINAMVTESMQLVAGKIIVMQAGLEGLMMGFAGSDITDEQVETIENIDGIESVVPMIWYMEGFELMQGAPEWVAFGMPPEKSHYFIGENVDMYEGRRMTEDETGSCVIGKDVADKFKLETGDYFTIKENDFEIVGVVEKTNIPDIDMGVIVSIDELQTILEMDTYQMLYVVPEEIENTEYIADEIENEDENLQTLIETDMARMADEIVGQIRIFTIGIGAIAAFVGGLGVMNTMIMAVIERRREIGVMKALGATRAAVLTQILQESAIISLVGGFGGLVIGFIASLGLGVLTGGMLTAVVTPALALGGLGFALLLGLVGGLYPAWRAAKLDPVEALRYE